MSFGRNKGTNPAREHFERTTRWKERFENQYEIASNSDMPDPNILMDYAIIVFQHVFHTRDWLLKQGVDRNSVKELFSSSEMKLCRDISNGTKHLLINTPSIDKEFSLRIEYAPSNPMKYELIIVAGNTKFQLLYLMNSCYDQLTKFVKENGILSRQNFFQS